MRIVAGHARGFPVRCGSTLRTREDGGEVCVKIASLEHPGAVVPCYHIYV
jgi:hypothetical protein